MQFDRIGIQPRLRNAWQAIDLGWMMARRWWWPLFLAWCIPYCTLFTALLLLLPNRLWWLASAISWWLKPLWDATPLYILSRRLFGEAVPPPAAWRAVLRSMRWEILPWLTWRRLTPTRSLDLPITVLEQLRGNARARRLRVLHMRTANAAGWLTLACANLEWVIGSGLIGLVLWMLPHSISPSLNDLLGNKDPLLQIFRYFCFALGATAIAPFYVAAGFSLYINRRIELEGWDIEIRFRRMATSTKPATSPRRPAAVAILSALLCLPLLSPPARAEDRATAAASENSTDPAQQQKLVQQRIQKILDGADFKSAKIEHHWRFKKQPDEQTDSKVPEWLIRIIEAMESVTGFSLQHQQGLIDFVDGLRAIFWTVLIGLFAYLLLRFRDSLREWLHLPVPQHSTKSMPEILFGLDVRADSVSDDVIEQVNRLCLQQRCREALSLLYRASLTKLLHNFDLPFRDDMTEGECVQIVAAGTRTDTKDFFTRLTRSWQLQAYAHIAPAPATMEQLCKQWQQVFGDAR